MLLRVAVVLAVIGFGGSGAAHPASFDCRRAASAIDQLICSDPELSRLDEALAAAYDEAYGELSDDGRAVLQHGQRQWLRYSRVGCDLKRGPDYSAGGYRTCVQHAYEDRINDLKVAAVRIGPYLFGRVDSFTLQPSDSGVSQQYRTSYPRIDAPNSEINRRWNTLVALRPTLHSSCESPGENTEQRRVLHATERTISLEHGSDFYCSGTPHGYGDSVNIIYALQPEPRVISSSDLFEDRERWREFLGAQVYAAVRETLPGVKERQIAEAATSDSNWALSESGLIVTIGPDDTGDRAAGVQEVRIPWADLRRFLRADAPVP